ncbi:hydantoinase B/oxoprolinase family protein [Marinibaculum pumilum]|uniref:Hydantoinase B/oxoprolinase family protein n=1 Tax=Marinibaculum pumilum TaxID=1766165 RepID=A0ABV7L4D0_9PROT
MTAQKDTDGAKLAIMSNRLEGISRKMANTLLRTGRSGVLNLARDFSCCIVTADHQLLASAESLPIHVLSGPDMMARSMVQFHPKLKRGDAFLHNSPYHGCSHPADHTLLVPVMDDAGRHRFTVLAKAHQADCGNSQPTTYLGSAKDIYEEGALIFPAVKIQDDYRNIDDIIRMCRMRIRVPEQWWGDYLAMVGAARIGERELMALAAEVGWDALEAHTKAWFDYSEERMVKALKQIPSGTAEWTSTHDHFPGTPETGIPVNVKVQVDAEAGRIEVDMTDNLDNLPCGLNLSEACARTSAMVGIYNSIDHTVPKNAGAHRRISIKLREGCVVGIPKHPYSCSVATTNLADRVANSVQAAMAELRDGIGLAECGAIIPPSCGVISGKDPKDGSAYVNQVFLGFTGGAGGPTQDAWLTLGHVGNAGLCYQDSVELDEQRHPIMIYRREMMADSEGAGRTKGAARAYVEYGPFGGGTLEIGYVSDGATNAAKGTRGGGTGGPAEQYRAKADGSREPLPGCAQVVLQPDERMISISCGGGGYGPPHERAPEKVLHDVREKWISRERARDIYLVAITHDLKVDQAATAELRAKVAQAAE